MNKEQLLKWAMESGTESKPTIGSHACFCIGPRDGEPLCRCAMRAVKIINGRYVRIEDLGPAPSHPTPAAE